MLDRILIQLVRSTPNIVYVSDVKTYEIVYLNESGKKICNIESDEDYKGKKCYEVIQGRSTPCTHCTQEHELFDDPQRRTIYNDFLDKHFLHTEKSIYTDDKMRLCILIDVTEAYAERAVKEALLSCVETLYNNKQPDESITELLQILANSYRSSHAYIFSLCAKDKFFNCTHQWYNDDALPFTLNSYTVPFENLHNFVEDLKEQGALLVNINDENYFDVNISNRLRELKINNMIMAPLYDNNYKFLGLVGVNNPNRKESCTRLITSICKFVADFLEKTKLIESLNTLSFTDALTHLKNRHSYSLCLADFEQNPPSSLGVIYCDVNGLKEVNDKFGHAKGDELLISLAKILNDLFAEDAYRIGGDEFVVLKSNISEHDFNIMVQLLRDNLEEMQELSVSFGNIWSDNSVDISKQIESADSLMYTEKLLYYQNTHENAKYRTILRNSLEVDIESGRFAVFLQPQFNLQSNELCGAEALLRKLNSSKNIDNPAYFVPLYEKLEIVHLLDFYVFETICQVLNDWRLACYDELTVSVNVSRVTLKQPNVAKTFKALCDKYKISPSKILVEITETMQAQSSEFFSLVLSELASEGFLLSLDDFGSGYSSLLTLAESEFSEIKIDQGFIRGITSSSRALSLVKYTINMCNDLNIFDTVAEGIETEEICTILRDIKCTKGQGYLFDKAMPIDLFSQKYIFPKD